METREHLPNWLKKTQQNSWEPEIFISGIVLFALLQLPEILNKFRYFILREVHGLSNDIDNLVAVLATGIQWLTLGLILHLFFRGIWIGLVGLSYVFPSGINKENVKFQGKFNNRINSIPSFSKQIITLEKISSSIFSISYFLFMSILGAYFFFCVALLLPIYILVFTSDDGFMVISNSPVTQKILSVYVIIVLVIGFIHMFDFFTLGLLKRHKWTAKVYYPIYKFMSWVTFSSLYRNIYYVLISNFKKWKVAVFIIFFIIVSFFLFGANSSRTATSRLLSRLDFYGNSSGNHISSSAYANMSPRETLQRVTIQSDIIKDDVLRIFVTHQKNYEDSIRSSCNYQEFEEEYKQDSLNLTCMAEFYQLQINDSSYTDIKWLFHYDGKTTHRGIMTYVDIGHLPKGMNKLDVNLNNWFVKNYATVPFYKE